MIRLTNANSRRRFDSSLTLGARRRLRNPHKICICGCVARKCSATSMIIELDCFAWTVRGAAAERAAGAAIAVGHARRQQGAGALCCRRRLRREDRQPPHRAGAGIRAAVGGDWLPGRDRGTLRQIVESRRDGDQVRQQVIATPNRRARPRSCGGNTRPAPVLVRTKPRFEPKSYDKLASALQKKGPSCGSGHASDSTKVGVRRLETR
jgi:hypothetical protein